MTKTIWILAIAAAFIAGMIIAAPPLLALDNDVDGDSLANEFDNCPFVATGGVQEDDSDGDGIGDACDTRDDRDLDDDGLQNDVDNCPFVPNPDQNDGNGDGLGDACTNQKKEVEVPPNFSGVWDLDPIPVFLCQGFPFQIPTVEIVHEGSELTFTVPIFAGPELTATLTKNKFTATLTSLNGEASLVGQFKGDNTFNADLTLETFEPVCPEQSFKLQGIRQ